MNSVTGFRGTGPMIIVGLLISATGAQATTWNVDPTGGGDATGIWAAVCLAAEGDTISIADGTYTEVVTAPAGMVFMAKNPGQVTWAPSQGSCLFATNTSTIEVHGIRFSGPGGRAVYLNNLSGSATVSQCTFENWTGPYSGPAIVSEYQSIEILDCVFSNCQVSGPLDAGAVHLYDSNSGSRIIGSTFTACSAGGNGGAVDASALGLMIEDCSFTNCQADNGGAVYFYCGQGRIQNCVFETNTATTDGGALYFYSSSGDDLLLENEFRSNSAGGKGGALCGYSLGPQNTGDVISGSLFVGNSAAEGGAVYDETCTETLECNTFYNNTATSARAAIYVHSGSPSVTQSIFSDNKQAAAIHCLGTPTISCSDFWQNAVADVSGGAQPQAADGNIFMSPEFCNARTGNFDLALDSPCTAANVPGGCGIHMGCRETGCDQSPVRHVSWGRLRGLFK